MAFRQVKRIIPVAVLINRLYFLCRESFERECSGYPGFITKFKVADRSSQNNADSETVDFENFRYFFLLFSSMI